MNLNSGTLPVQISAVRNLVVAGIRRIFQISSPRLSKKTFLPLFIPRFGFLVGRSSRSLFLAVRFISA